MVCSDIIFNFDFIYERYKYATGLDDHILMAIDSDRVSSYVAFGFDERGKYSELLTFEPMSGACVMDPVTYVRPFYVMKKAWQMFSIYYKFDCSTTSYYSTIHYV